MRWREVAGLGGPLVLLTLLSLRDLGALSLWRDEVASVVFASGSLGDLLTVVGRSPDVADLGNMATYYVLLHFWMVGGENEAWIRLLSVIAGVAAVVPVYFVARRLAAWPAAPLAAGIFVLMPYVVQYNREARGYSLSMLVTAGLTWLLLIGVERRTVLPWAAYGVLAALGIYVHFFVALVVAAHAAWAIATRSLPPWPAVLAALVPILIATAPIPLIVLRFGGEQEWIPPLSGPVAAGALMALAGGPILLLAMSVLLAYGLVRLSSDSRAWLLVGCVLLPLACGALISLVKPMFVGRYFIMVLPQLAILLAWAIVAMRPQVVAAASAATLGVLLVVAVPSAYADRYAQDWRAAGAWMAGKVQPGDAVIAQNGRRPIEYYLGRAGAPVMPLATRVEPALEDLDLSRVWVAVLGGAEGVDDRDVSERLSRRFEVAERRPFGARLTILLMVERRAAEAPG